ncbi:MAG: hypothetical protein ABIH72_00960 [archaeon]
MPEAVKLEKKAELLANPGYASFIDSLQELYNLSHLHPENITWIGENTRRFDTKTHLEEQIDIRTDCPVISVRLIPLVDGKPITGQEVYNAPLLLSDVSTLATSPIKRYQITKNMDAPESQERLPSPVTLAQKIKELKFATPIKDTTLVVDLVSLLPVAPNREFLLEFNPHMSFQNGSHSFYQVAVIGQDAISIYNHQIGGEPRDLKRIATNIDLNNWKAEAVPDLSSLEQALVADKTGHIIYIASPFEFKPQGEFDYKDLRLLSQGYFSSTRGGSSDFFSPLDYDSGFKSSSPLLKGFTPMQKKARVSETSLSQGRKSGTGILSTEQTLATTKGIPVIYHLYFLSVKPEEAKSISSETLDRVSSYAFSKN